MIIKFIVNEKKKCAAYVPEFYARIFQNYYTLHA
jgi:hypothetical protein